MLRTTDREPYEFDEPRGCETCAWWNQVPGCRSCGYRPRLGFCTANEWWSPNDDTCRKWEGYE